MRVDEDYLIKNARWERDYFQKVKIFTELIGKDFDWTIYCENKDWNAIGVSRAVQCINTFQESGHRALGKVKEELYKHYECVTHNELCDVPIEFRDKNPGNLQNAFNDFFKVSCPEDAYKVSILVGLSAYIGDPSYIPNQCDMEFRIPWDPEHILRICVQNGSVTLVE